MKKLIVGLIILITVFFLNQAFSQSKKALLIGINDYSNVPGCISFNGSDDDIAMMKSLLLSKYRFKENDIEILFDKEATKQGIVDALNKITSGIKIGDIIVFYFTGHGSYQKNSLSFNNPSKLDEGIVTYDAGETKVLLRDKELAHLFDKMIKRGAVLTCIYDCCHSGGMSRGFFIPYGYINKSAEFFIEIDAMDPAEPPVISEEGALILAACTKEQEAQTSKEGSIFTCSLTAELKNSHVNEPVSKLMSRVSARVQVRFTNQEPVASGNGRMNKSFLGDGNSSLPDINLFAVIKGIYGKDVLNAGKAAGLYAGCILKKYYSDKTEKDVEIVLTDVKNLNFSNYEILKGNDNDIETGDLFYVTKWKIAGKHNLSVWIPFTDKSNEDLKKFYNNIINELSGKVSIVDEPTAEVPSKLIYFNNQNWILISHNKEINLGINPEINALNSHFQKDDKLFVSLPLQKSVYDDVEKKYKDKFNNINLLNSPEGANFILHGRAENNEILYSWFRTNSTDNNKSTMPGRTTWLSSNYKNLSDSIIIFSTKLGKINAWLGLDNPFDNENFPYSIAVKRKNDGKILQGEEPLYDGDICQLILITDNDKLSKWNPKNPRYVYVIGLDKDGRTFVLYPQDNDIEHIRKLPYDYQSPPLEIELESSSFKIKKPFGIDTYILLTSDSRIPDIQLLNDDIGVITDEIKTKSLFDDFASYIFGTTTAQRRGDITLTTNWTVKRITIESRKSE